MRGRSGNPYQNRNLRDSAFGLPEMDCRTLSLEDVEILASFGLGGVPNSVLQKTLTHHVCHDGEGARQHIDRCAGLYAMGRFTGGLKRLVGIIIGSRLTYSEMVELSDVISTFAGGCPREHLLRHSWWPCPGMLGLKKGLFRLGPLQHKDQIVLSKLHAAGKWMRIASQRGLLVNDRDEVIRSVDVKPSLLVRLTGNARAEDASIEKKLSGRHLEAVGRKKKEKRAKKFSSKGRGTLLTACVEPNPGPRPSSKPGFALVLKLDLSLCVKNVDDSPKAPRSYKPGFFEPLAETLEEVGRQNAEVFYAEEDHLPRKRRREDEVFYAEEDRESVGRGTLTAGGCVETNPGPPKSNGKGKGGRVQVQRAALNASMVDQVQKLQGQLDAAQQKALWFDKSLEALYKEYSQTCLKVIAELDEEAVKLEKELKQRLKADPPCLLPDDMIAYTDCEFAPENAITEKEYNDLVHELGDLGPGDHELRRRVVFNKMKQKYVYATSMTTLLCVLLFAHAVFYGATVVWLLFAHLPLWVLSAVPAVLAAWVKSYSGRVELFVNPEDRSIAQALRYAMLHHVTYGWRLPNGKAYGFLGTVAEKRQLIFENFAYAKGLRPGRRPFDEDLGKFVSSCRMATMKHIKTTHLIEEIKEEIGEEPNITYSVTRWLRVTVEEHDFEIDLNRAKNCLMMSEEKVSTWQLSLRKCSMEKRHEILYDSTEDTVPYMLFYMIKEAQEMGQLAYLGNWRRGAQTALCSSGIRGATSRN